MKKYLILLFTLIASGIIIFFSLMTNHKSISSNINILSWPKMKIDAFGCMLEKSFDYRDDKFNCNLSGYINKGDPCRNLNDYYEGMSFPGTLSKTIHPEIHNIDLKWEHGLLQSITFTMSHEMSESEIANIFVLSNLKNYPNVMYSNIQNCNIDTTCLILTGFDHIGSGEVECNNID